MNPWFFTSMIFETSGSLSCASRRLIEGLTDTAQDSLFGTSAFSLRLGTKLLLINVGGVVTRALVESV